MVVFRWGECRLWHLETRCQPRMSARSFLQGSQGLCSLEFHRSFFFCHLQTLVLWRDQNHQTLFPSYRWRRGYRAWDLCGWLCEHASTLEQTPFGLHNTGFLTHGVFFFVSGFHWESGLCIAPARCTRCHGLQRNEWSRLHAYASEICGSWFLIGANNIK